MKPGLYLDSGEFIPADSLNRFGDTVTEFTDAELGIKPPPAPLDWALIATYLTSAALVVGAVVLWAVLS